MPNRHEIAMNETKFPGDFINLSLSTETNYLKPKHLNLMEMIEWLESVELLFYYLFRCYILYFHIK